MISTPSFVLIERGRGVTVPRLARCGVIRVCGRSRGDNTVLPETWKVRLTFLGWLHTTGGPGTGASQKADTSDIWFERRMK